MRGRARLRHDAARHRAPDGRNPEFWIMAALPIKMILRWTVNLKYIVAMPEIFFNI